MSSVSPPCFLGAAIQNGFCHSPYRFPASLTVDPVSQLTWLSLWPSRDACVAWVKKIKIKIEHAQHFPVLSYSSSTFLLLCPCRWCGIDYSLRVVCVALGIIKNKNEHSLPSSCLWRSYSKRLLPFPLFVTPCYFLVFFAAILVSKWRFPVACVCHLREQIHSSHPVRCFAWSLPRSLTVDPVSLRHLP